MAAAGLPAPAIALPRPAILDGVQSGDVTGNSAVVWSRCDQLARLVVEWDTTERFSNPRRVAGSVATPLNGHCATAELTGLPPGETVVWRAAFEDVDRPGAISAPQTGRLRTHAEGGRPVRFVFGGDQVGAGWGINLDWGGMRIYETMLTADPDFLIHLGDRIYSDAALRPVLDVPDGPPWKNLVTPAKSRIAASVADYRGNYSYNFLDGHYRRFAATVPQLCTWDDHEVADNWWPGRAQRKKRYRVGYPTLAMHGRRAFFDYTPMRRDPVDPDRIYRNVRYGKLVEVFMLDTRSYRSANQTPESSEDFNPLLGVTQAAWLKDALARSDALWKVIATSVPIETRSPKERRQDKWADGTEGSPHGREAELADILSFIRTHGIRNTVWVAADVHYGAAIHFHPDRAAFRDFEPFWEFIAGPFLTRTRRPHKLDMTFGPDRVFATTGKDLKRPVSPYHEKFWFGQGDIDPASGALTMTIRDLHGRALFTQTIEPDRRASGVVSR